MPVPIIVRQGQTLTDICLQYYGTQEDIFKLAGLNGISTSDFVVPGQTLLVEPQINSITTFYRKKAITVAAGRNNTDIGGIGYWIIEDTFKVS